MAATLSLGLICLWGVHLRILVGDREDVKFTSDVNVTWRVEGLRGLFSSCSPLEGVVGSLATKESKGLSSRALELRGVTADALSFNASR